MSDFKAKMHQIRFRLGSAPDPTGELTALPQTPYMVLRGPTSKEREGRGRKEAGEGGKEGKDEGEGKGSPGLSRDRVGNPSFVHVFHVNRK